MFMMKNIWSTFKKTRKSKPFTVNKSSFLHQASGTSQHIVVTKRSPKHHRVDISQKLDLGLHYIRSEDKYRTMENLIERSFYYDLDGDRKMREAWSDDLDIEIEEAKQTGNDTTMMNVYGEPIFYSMNDLKNYYYNQRTRLGDQPKFTYIPRFVFSDDNDEELNEKTESYSPHDRQEETTFAEEITTSYEQQVITQQEDDQDEAANYNVTTMSTTTTPVIATRPFASWNPQYAELPSFPLPNMSIHTQHIPDYPTEEQLSHQDTTHFEEPVVLQGITPLPELASLAESLPLLAKSPPLAQTSALQQYLLASSYYPAEQVLSPEPFQLDSPYPTGPLLSPGSPPANLPSFNNYYSAESQSSLNTHNIEETMSSGTPPLPESSLANSPLLFNNYDQTEQAQFSQNTTYMNEAMSPGTPPSRESSSLTTAYPPITADLSSPTADEPSYYPESPSLQNPFYSSPPPPQESIMYPMHDEPLLQDSPVLSQDNNDQQPLLMAPLNFVGQEWLPSSPPEPGRTRASLPDSDHDINSSSTKYFPNSSMSSAANELENAMMNLTVQSNNDNYHVAEQQNNEEEETGEGLYQEYREEEEEEKPLQELDELLDA